MGHKNYFKVNVKNKVKVVGNVIFIYILY